VRPVIVLTKADLSPAPERFVEAAGALQSGLRVELLDGRSPASAWPLAEYCGFGETVALVGSSGVGKSTLINTLTGSDAIATQAVREDDGKGRHTKTVREMHRLAASAGGGGWLIDTPGMRELQMFEVTAGVAEVFDHVIAMTLECRSRTAPTPTSPDAPSTPRWRKEISIPLASNGGASSPMRMR